MNAIRFLAASKSAPLVRLLGFAACRQDPVGPVDREDHSPENAPATPTGLVAQATSASQIKLAWTDNSTNELDFSIERADGAASCRSVT